MNAPATAPGRPRSLGASLLDQVLAETLDPAYAQAAEARAARAAADPGAAARRSTRRFPRGQVLVALTLVLAGFLSAVTYREAAAGAQGRQQVREALIDDINRQSAATDELADQLEALTADVTRTRAEALTASAVGQRALGRLQVAEQGAGLVAVSGPGLEVTVGNAAPDSDSDPVGGSPAVAESGLVQDSDLQLVVNALWSAGAEAISINGQRLGPTTTIRQAGGAVLVDFRPVASPYQVLAVGDPDDLANGFLSSPEASYVVGLQQEYGLQFDFARADDLSLPAGTIPEVRWAQPLNGPADPSSPQTPTDGD
ncbi:Uncharacterized conserved protein YlxW, UPF0749 family [Modestobacter sp. DSM 44400]|uniref:DUF881 domain-containing protein n=1 Tax=Modestobacter sp. DSM 44400 TaxID=1550230 RepID=UPI0008946A0A|nr:DUF881 domain-containing protein [Modestobacter sp. DSM 44400]SDY20269.1 Uncharacterized conserved protein YlxW, UPF0749 family [Modestobacter sp. DSM 44400]